MPELPHRLVTYQMLPVLSDRICTGLSPGTGFHQRLSVLTLVRKKHESGGARDQKVCIRSRRPFSVCAGWRVLW